MAAFPVAHLRVYLALGVGQAFVLALQGLEPVECFYCVVVVALLLVQLHEHLQHVYAARLLGHEPFEHAYGQRVLAVRDVSLRQRFQVCCVAGV